jgi:hypothetical protein
MPLCSHGCIIECTSDRSSVSRVTKRRNETLEGRKQRDSRNQRNTPKRKASLTTQTSIMPHATTTPAQRAHQTPPPGTMQPRTPAEKPQSDPQRRDPQHPYRPFRRGASGKHQWKALYPQREQKELPSYRAQQALHTTPNRHTTRPHRPCTRDHRGCKPRRRMTTIKAGPKTGADSSRAWQSHTRRSGQRGQH